MAVYVTAVLAFDCGELQAREARISCDLDYHRILSIKKQEREHLFRFHNQIHILFEQISY